MSEASREEKVEYLAKKLKIPRSEADRLLENLKHRDGLDEPEVVQ